MLEQLNEASKILEAALNSYLNTYKDVYSHYVTGTSIGTIPSDLATGLVHHLSIVESFKDRLEVIQSYAGRCRNAVPSLIPIHTLPFEVLTRIFQLLGHRCAGSLKEFALYPQSLPTLMTVCRHWHHVIVNSPCLWTHIDLQVKGDHTTIPQMNYAKLRVQRATQMQLEVHLGNLSLDFPEPQNYTSFIPFIVSIASRVRSFAFKLHDPIPALVALFNYCTPGILKTLQMGTRNDLTILNADTGKYRRVLSADLSEERFETIFQGVVALQLDYILPTNRWTSSAYHGLVELRIKCSRGVKITESQFVGILRQSLGLRILEYAEPPCETLAGGVQVEPIVLPDLEVLNLGSNGWYAVGEIVRWLAPGSKPLQLLLPVPANFEPCLLAFIRRSNITRLYSWQHKLTNVMYFVRHFPQMRTLALRFHRAHDQNMVQEPKYEVPSSLETLYVTSLDCFNLGTNAFRELFLLESLRRVIFCGDALDYFDTFILHVSAAIQSRIEFISIPKDEPDPLSEWELLSLPMYHGQRDYLSSD